MTLLFEYEPDEIVVSMSTLTDSPDAQFLELLRAGDATTVSEIAKATGVTDTAVRQRLNRLMSEGLVQRKTVRCGRGRPTHRYELTDMARRQLGSNFNDLAMILWREVRSVKDPQVRRGLIARIAAAFAKHYEPQVSGSTLESRMHSVAELFSKRRVPFAVEHRAGAPVLTTIQCPYPELAEQDRGICAVERLLFSQLLDAEVRLSECRLDGHRCCQFSLSGATGN